MAPAPAVSKNKKNLKYENIPLIVFLRPELNSAHLKTPDIRDFAIFNVQWNPDKVNTSGP